MQHVKLGRTGLRVSRLCLGTMTFGLQCDEPRATPSSTRAAEAGIDFLDTADVYPLGGGLDTVGRTEEIVGDWLKGKRQRLHRRHQVRRPDGPEARGTGACRASTSSTPSTPRCAGSAPTTSTSTSSTATTRTRRSTRRSRRSTRSCAPARRATSACSNWPAYQVARALGRSEVQDLVRFDSVQPRYNLLFRAFERDLLPLCAEEGDRRDPLQPARRRAADRQAHRRRRRPRARASRSAPRRRAYQERYWHDREFETVDALRSWPPRPACA